MPQRIEDLSLGDGGHFVLLPERRGDPVVRASEPSVDRSVGAAGYAGFGAGGAT